MIRRDEICHLPDAALDNYPEVVLSVVFHDLLPAFYCRNQDSSIGNQDSPIGNQDSSVGNAPAEQRQRAEKIVHLFIFTTEITPFFNTKSIIFQSKTSF